MSDLQIAAENIRHSYDGINYVLTGVSLKVGSGDILAITGPNGSGKSTLLKILFGVLKPSVGKISYSLDGQEARRNSVSEKFGFVAPYMNIYEEFSALEHIKLAAKLSGRKYDEAKALALLGEFNLKRSKSKAVSEFSSGMKQRFKFVLAALNEPVCYFLDEPSSNLDDQGFALIANKLKRFAGSGGAAIIAANDPREKELCDGVVEM